MESILEDRIDVIEVELIASEHRWTHIARNFVRAKQWANDDPRKSAAWMAVLWRVVAPATVALSIGAGGLLIGGYTAYLFHEQNETLAALNQQTATQFKLEDSRRKLQRKTELIGVLWDVSATGPRPSEGVGVAPPEAMVPVASAVHRREAVVEYVELLLELGEEVNLAGARLDGIRATKSWPLVIAEHLSGASLRGAYLEGLDLGQVNLTKCDLTGAYLANAHIPGAALRGAVLEGATFANCDLRGADMGGALFPDANFRWADLRGANLSGPDIVKDHMVNVNLGTELRREAELSGRDIYDELYDVDDYQGPGVVGGDENIEGRHIRESLARGESPSEGSVLDLFPTLGVESLFSKMSSAELSTATLHGAKWNANTTWPEGFVPPADTMYFDVDNNRAPHPK